MMTLKTIKFKIAAAMRTIPANLTRTPSSGRWFLENVTPGRDSKSRIKASFEDMMLLLALKLRGVVLRLQWVDPLPRPIIPAPPIKLSKSLVNTLPP
jgi:hypothetical protein